MTPVYFNFGVQHFYLNKMLIVVCKCIIQTKYIDKSEAKQKKKPITRGTDQFSSPQFSPGNIKFSFPMHRSSIVD